MSDELNDQLNIIHENLMDLLETAGTDALWVDGSRGLLVFVT